MIFYIKQINENLKCILACKIFWKFQEFSNIIYNSLDFISKNFFKILKIL